MPITPQSAPEQLTGCDIANNYTWDVRIAMAICLAESGGVSDQVGDNYVIAGLLAPSCGLWQIRTLAGRPTCEELKDPETNVLWAYKISNGGTDWTPWSVYKNGKYLKFL